MVLNINMMMIIKIITKLEKETNSDKISIKKFVKLYTLNLNNNKYCDFSRIFFIHVPHNVCGGHIHILGIFVLF